MGLRDFLKAWLRLFLAIASLTAPLPLLILSSWDAERWALWLQDAAGAWSAVALQGTLLATPLLFARRWIVQRERPFLKRGYLLVAGYGPLLLLWVKASIDGEWSAYVMMCVLYEVVASLVTAIYVLLWRVGDAGAGRLSTPLVVIAAFLAIAGAPFGVQFIRQDHCLDQGRVWRDDACE